MSWIKFYANGSHIQENKALGITWLKTPLVDIIEVALMVKGPNGTMVERRLANYASFWHSRTAVANESCKPIIVSERIQGLRNDGMWATTTWNGTDFIETLEDHAIGKPVIR